VRSLRLDASGGFQFSDALGQIFVGGQQFAEPDERMIRMFIRTARELFSTDDSIATPCSDKSYGK
jgi:hypothetical protein